MADGDARGFLILCDKDLESQVGELVGKLEDSESGEIELKTIEDVPTAKPKGGKFEQKMETYLKWAHGVVIVTSQNFATFIDKKKTDKLPTLMLKDGKGIHKVLEKFLKDESNKVSNKLIIISVNGDTTLPKCLDGKVQVIVRENERTFIERIKGHLASNMNR